MELDVHDALESLDRVVDLANQVEGALKENKVNLLPVKAKAESLERDISAIDEVLDQLAARDLSEPAIANATQRDLLDRQAQLDQLQRRSDDLHSCLPEASANQPNTMLDKIQDKVRDLEEKIGASIRRSAEKSPSKRMSLTEQKESDAISIASTGGQSLALEVQVCFPYF
ncbi:unnamed protein product [Gongylonema pulchrum]|uniref:SKA2 domain-containing protein n=1 Tax=Gongylonema pulchrum TaxID=637853 RepID=A0A183EB13_9BILA|nr:unnamed protein product [Gongylonema pulchrum]